MWPPAETRAIALSQGQESVRQEREGITIRMALVTCPCGRRLPFLSAFHCYYCGVWFCPNCAAEHFGKSRADYLAEKEAAMAAGGE